MIDNALYQEVLDSTRNEEFLIGVDEIFQSNDYRKIGDAIIRKVLEKYKKLNLDDIKKIISFRLGYDQKKYEQFEYDDMCRLLCERILGFKDYPENEFVLLNQQMCKASEKYNLLIKNINRKIRDMDNQVLKDDKQLKSDGILIQEQKNIVENNEKDKKLTKDLKMLEDKYLAIDEEITEKDVYKSMLLYVKRKTKEYFDGTVMSDKTIVTKTIRKIALQMAKEKEEIRYIHNVFDDYLSYIDTADNIITSIYKPFFLVKMRKFYNDITDYYKESCSKIIDDNLEPILSATKEKVDKIKDSDEWIRLKESDSSMYLSELNRYIGEYKVIEYINDRLKKIYCLQKRRSILESAMQLYQEQQNSIFINIVVIQIEGIISDFLIDANIQNRLDGKFDLYLADTFRNKLNKNDSMACMLELNLYFKFYFNFILRNRVAHGRGIFEPDNLAIISRELLLDLQYVINIVERNSNTSEAIEFIKNHLRWLEYSYKKENEVKNIYRKLFNSLNNNVIRHTRNGIGYVESQQELYFIFNPYYDKVYEFANITEQRYKIREYLLCKGFWRYVSDYIEKYKSEELHFDKIDKSFVSRVKAIAEYCEENRKEVVVDISEVLGKLEAMYCG